MFLLLSPGGSDGDAMSAEELERLVDTYGRAILRTAYMYVKDRQRAEDVCQEVYIKLFRSNKKFDSPDHEKAFVLRVTINMCKDMLKSFWSRRIVLDDTKEPDPIGDIADDAAVKDERRELYERVLSLPEKFKTVVLLYYYEGLSTSEISKMLDIPDATVRSRLKRAREKLYAGLKGGNADA